MVKVEQDAFSASACSNHPVFIKSNRLSVRIVNRNDNNPSAATACTNSNSFTAPTQPVIRCFIGDYLVKSWVNIQSSHRWVFGWVISEYFVAKYCTHIIAPTNIVRHPPCTPTTDMHLHLVAPCLQVTVVHTTPTYSYTFTIHHLLYSVKPDLTNRTVATYYTTMACTAQLKLDKTEGVYMSPPLVAC